MICVARYIAAFGKVCDGLAFGGVGLRDCGTLEGGVADFGYALRVDVGDEADVDGVLDVDVVGEADGEVEAGVVGGW